jgi:hypothetical protein
MVIPSVKALVEAVVTVVLPLVVFLGGHFKTGHQRTGQNRPPEVASETG